MLNKFTVAMLSGLLTGVLTFVLALLMWALTIGDAGIGGFFVWIGAGVAAIPVGFILPFYGITKPYYGIKRSALSAGYFLE